MERPMPADQGKPPADDRNRDDEQRPGTPPKSAYVPKGSAASTHTDKTRTDPETGAPSTQAPAPAESDTSRRD